MSARVRWPGSWLAALLASSLAAQVPTAPVAGTATTATPAATVLVPTVESAVRERAAAFLRQHRAPGLSLAVGRGGVVVFAAGFGEADVENHVAATEATVYRLASISKVVTAVAALQLAERGALDLDADVRRYVPEFPAKRWPVSTRQLLGHLGGVRHYKPGEAESTVHYATQRLGLERFAADPLLHEPGTVHHYSTFGFNLVAAAVESAGKTSFAAWVAHEIAAPCGAATLQDDDVRRIVPHRAQGYVLRDDVLENSGLMDGSYKLGGGGLCSNAPDLARFGMALLGGKLLAPASLATMTTSMTLPDGKATGYGCGLRIDERGGHREWWHTGAQSRVSTALLLAPDAGIVVVALCNLERTNPLPLARRVLDAVVGD